MTNDLTVIFVLVESKRVKGGLQPVGEIDTYHQFQQLYTCVFFVRTSFRQLFPCIRNVYVTRKKAAKTTFVQKFVRKNDDEIDTWMRTELLLDLRN